MTQKKRYDMARFFLALSNETRLTLLYLLKEREVCVCELVEALGQPQPKISQHLALLRRVSVVEARREGKWMHYRLTEPPSEEAGRILQAALLWVKNNAPHKNRRRACVDGTRAAGSC